jgi:hypothetical protein
VEIGPAARATVGRSGQARRRTRCKPHHSRRGGKSSARHKMDSRLRGNDGKDAVGTMDSRHAREGRNGRSRRKEFLACAGMTRRIIPARLAG